jgi:hypothetical protein
MMGKLTPQLLAAGFKTFAKKQEKAKAAATELVEELVGRLEDPESIEEEEELLIEAAKGRLVKKKKNIMDESARDETGIEQAQLLTQAAQKLADLEMKKIHVLYGKAKTMAMSKEGPPAKKRASPSGNQWNLYQQATPGMLPKERRASYELAKEKSKHLSRDNAASDATVALAAHGIVVITPPPAPEQEEAATAPDHPQQANDDPLFA